VTFAKFRQCQDLPSCVPALPAAKPTLWLAYGLLREGAVTSSGQGLYRENRSPYQTSRPCSRPPASRYGLVRGSFRDLLVGGWLGSGWASLSCPSYSVCRCRHAISISRSPVLLRCSFCPQQQVMSLHLRGPPHLSALGLALKRAQLNQLAVFKSYQTLRFRSSFKTDIVPPLSDNMAHHGRTISRYLEDTHDKIFENNRKWVESQIKDDPEFFNSLNAGQKPEYL